ncbi:MAG: RNA polymerase sigma factor [Vannielia sp.]|uniref:RNA polymerase sigma factor n=1 Tax=Vannielia sp. TaxID=2813045 RepID=UPI003B8AEACB
MTVSDHSLALAAAGGDRESFAALLARHYDRLHAFAFRLTGSRAEAEDLTQDICLALPAKLARYEGRAAFGTWLYRVAVNAAHDRRRRAASQAKAAEGWGDWEVARQAEISETDEAVDWLTATLRTLPEELRDTCALVLGEEMTQVQAGEVLGVSEGTIAWRMSEVKKRLRAVATEERAS